MYADTIPAARSMVGRTLKGQYRIEAELGGGAMGVVFRGMQLALGKPVAIKMLRPDRFLTQQAQERFEREARTVSMLVHPGIAQVFDYGIEEGLPFLVMELVEGKELAEVIEQEGPMAPARAVAIMRQLASVLEEAHRHGVVHRDIKPQNIKLMRYVPGGPIFLKVLDFGIAKQVGAEQDKLTATGAVLGTPAYMAPEQAAGTSQKVDGRADQYAAGVVLYEMLTGTVPFGGDSVAGVLVSHLTRPPPPLPEAVPEPLRQVVERLLRKQPEERFPDCGALDRALQACEAACRDVPPLGRNSVQPVVGDAAPTVPRRVGWLLGLGSLAIAGAMVAAALVYGPALRRSALSTSTSPDVAQAGSQALPPPVASQPGQGGAVGSAAQDVAAKPPTRPSREEPHRGRRSGAGAMAIEEVQPDGRPGANPEAEAKVAEATRLFEEKKFNEAIRVARQSIGLRDSPQARRLITLSYCALADLEHARAAFHSVPFRDRRSVIAQCLANGVDLRD
ncbi:MAG: serine/threonine-protein kinase [Myxococcales bacterium]|nr:serine/threonine protein kinase [Myxococcota bacterium]MDW8280696.1 serine/threonine-protein kinase [Myxococcales bacterium]